MANRSRRLRQRLVGAWQRGGGSAMARKKDFTVTRYFTALRRWCFQFHRRDSKRIKREDGGCYRRVVYSH
ncbi:hypothetical protein CASFOL_011143 [Castilleja foliolosa]|uniref:Uncharacterized protein n=1 Tax=Castilleja foliolosa TaxID=1961234 RepID=A0ABD3DV26_9LAMI